MNLRLKAFEVFAAEAKLRQGQRDVAVVEHADDGLLAVDEWHRVDAQVDRAVFQHHLNTTVLGQEMLGGVQRRHPFNARQEGGREVTRQLHRLAQDAVHTKPHADLPFGWLDVDVAGPLPHCGGEDVTDQFCEGTPPILIVVFVVVFERLFNQVNGIAWHSVERVVDYEDLRIGQ